MIAWIDKHLKYIFTLPAVVLVLVMIAFPIGYTAYLSFCEWSMSNIEPMQWVGLRNYAELFADSRFWNAVRMTLSYSAVSVSLEAVFGVAIAILLSKVRRCSTLLKTVFILPMVATPVAMGMVWKLMYEPTIGFLNNLLVKLGLPVSTWLSSSNTVFSSLVVIDVWLGTPLIILIVLSGVSAIPQEPYESAHVDGASAFQILRRVTLPLLSPTILAAVLMRLIDSLKTFDIIYSTTMGGPGYSSENLNILAYRNAFEYFYFGKSSAVLMLFMLLVLGVTIVFIYAKKRVEVEY